MTTTYTTIAEEKNALLESIITKKIKSIQIAVQHAKSINRRDAARPLTLAINSANVTLKLLIENKRQKIELKKVTESAAREEQAKERQADFAIQDAAKEEKKVDKATLEYLKKKEIEREIAEQKRKEEAERLARITTAVRDGDRFHSRCQISIKKIGTFAYGTWHKRFVSLGYREFRLYKKKKHTDPGMSIYIGPGSLVRYVPKTI